MQIFKKVVTKTVITIRIKCYDNIVVDVFLNICVCFTLFGFRVIDMSYQLVGYFVRYNICRHDEASGYGILGLIQWQYLFNIS